MAAKKKIAPKTTAEEMLKEFSGEYEVLQQPHLYLLTDKRTGATYAECHIRAYSLIHNGTTDVALDPEEQGDYRANREIVPNHKAFQRMKEDALLGRTFSNIVCEYTKEFGEDKPIKIIGGQHRFMAISEALEAGIDEYHGVKVYVNLNTEQRLDVQLISNTNIAVSADLFDRMHETVRGPELRDWCQQVGLLGEGEDFADRRERGGPISVQWARTFITNFFLGMEVDPTAFSTTDTSPVLCSTGQHDAAWEQLAAKKDVWTNQKLKEAGTEFALLISAQRAAFSSKKTGHKPDFPEKAMNVAIIAAWAYVAGMLGKNDPRKKRHFELRASPGKDPLNAQALAKGRHKSDKDN